MFLSKITAGFFIREWKKGLRDDGSKGTGSEGEDVIHLARKTAATVWIDIFWEI